MFPKLIIDFIREGFAPLSLGTPRLVWLVVGAVAFAGCGTQINSLKNPLRINSGALGVPPDLTSLVIVDASPTNHSPLTLNWGLTVGDVTQYCLLENDSNAAHCIWHSGALPTTYVDTASDGAFQLNAFVKNTYGASAAVPSNTITIDRTAPVLASATVANSNPTNNQVYSLSYGAVTNLPYAEYCLLENTTSSAGCTWVAGSLPASFTVSAGSGSKAISIWLRDAAGNVSNRVTTAAVDYDASVPTVSITSPAAGTYANLTNFAAFSVGGMCSVNGATVVITGAVSSSATCTGGAWSASLNLTAVADGAFTVYADLTNAAGTPATQASRAFNKDTVAPTVAIASPAAGAYANASNYTAFPISGTCSENGGTVVLSGAVSTSVACSAGNWSTNLDLTSVGAGAFTINADLTDVGGNPAVQYSRSFNKDVGVPTVFITSPAAGTYVTAANASAFSVSGTCSENGRTVSIAIASGPSASPTCTAGAWSVSLDVSALADAPFTVTANHSDAAGNAAAQDSRSFNKDVGIPTVTLTSPSAGAYATAATASAFVVSGACSENGRAVSVAISGGPSASPTCTAGAWSATLDVTSLADGAFTVTADHSDAAGNSATQASRTFNKDVGLPTVFITSPAAGTAINLANQSSFTVSGTCSENGRTVSISGALTSSATCTAGAWSANLDFTSVADGAVTIRADLSDAAGNAATQDSRSFTKNTGVPAVAITSPLAGAYANIANAASFAVSGTCSENGQPVNVAISGGPSASPTCTGGNWSTNLNVSGLSDGSFTVTADHSNSGGNPAPQDSRTFNKDVGAPTVFITSPSAGAYATAATASSFTVSGTCSENGRAVTVAVASGPSATPTCTAGTWTTNLNVSTLSDGAFTVTADLTDAAGNPATQDSRSFNKDVGVPTVFITSPAAASYANIANVASFAVSGTCSENGRAVSVAVAGGPSASPTCTGGNWSTNLDLSALGQGAFSVTADHSDAAGNAAVQASRSFTKDTVAPNAPQNLAWSGGSAQNSTTVHMLWDGTTSPDTANSQIYQMFDDATCTHVITGGGPSYSATNDYSTVVSGEGTYTFKITALDLAGNTTASACSPALVVDTTAPSVVITGPSAGTYATAATASSFAVSGTCSENGRTVTVAVSGGPSATPTCTAGNWSTNLNVTALADGAFTVTADLTDAAGNSATQDSRSFNKDVGVPTVFITSPSAGSYINAANLTSFNIAGTCSENGQNVVLSGSISTSTPCAAGAWSVNIDFTAIADGAITVNANHSDVAGNAATQDSRSFTKDSTAPTLASMAITNSTPTNNTSYGLSYGAQSGTFSSVCILENSTNFSGCSSAWVAQSTLPASFTVSGTNNVKSLTIWLKDNAGNVSTLVTSSNSVELDTVAPVVTVVAPNGGENILSGDPAGVAYTASDVNLAANPISLKVSTDSGTSWAAPGSFQNKPNTGTMSFNAPVGDSNQYRVRIVAVDTAGNVGQDDSDADFTVDSTAPVFTASQMTVNGGVSPSLSNYVPVAFQSTDSAAKITAYCLKYNSTTAPAAGDSCWVAVTPTNTLNANVNFRLGFAAGAYTVYGWTKNAVGLISSLTNAGAGTDGQDSASITFSPVQPPALTGVTASSADGSVNLSVTSGSTVYIKWNASTTGVFPASPISIYYTTDDKTYTAVTTGVANSQGAGCTISGSETGCYTWTNGAPTSSYFRIRVGAVDTNSRQSFQSTLPMNVTSTLRIIAGSTDPGTGGSAEAAIFATASLSSGWQDPQSFVVTTSGVVYFADSVRGILKVDPSNGTQQLLLPKATSGNGVDGAVPGATVKDVVKMAFDSQNRVLLFDYDRIRRYDPTGNTVTTIIGGGGSTAATVAPLSLQMTSMTSSNSYQYLLYGAADGKIYFQAENYAWTPIGGNYIMRVYDPGTNQVTSRTFSGTGDGYSASQDITLCNTYGMGAAFDSVTGAVQKIVLKSQYGTYAGCSDGSDHFPYISINPATDQSQAPHPAGSSYSDSFAIGADGRLLSIDRISAVVKVFDTATASFTTILGTGTSGVCADGTVATSCAIDVSDAFSDATGKIYFLERGKIRTIDQSNTVQTVMGSGFTTGDGGPATSARLGIVNEVRLWNNGSNDKVILGDGSEYRLREFDIDGNISTIAGNGNNGHPNTTASAVGQPIAYNDNAMVMPIRLQVDPSNGTVYASLRTNSRISKIDRSTGKWVDIVGGGATNWDSASADGKLGNQIKLNGYAPLVAAFDGTNLMDLTYVYNGSSMVKIHKVSDGTQTALIGVTGSANAAADYSADGTAGNASTSVWHAAVGMQSAIWDAYGSRWVFNNGYTNTSKIRSITVGGNLGTVATLPQSPSGFTYRHDASNNIIYYCRSSNQKLYKYNVTTSTNTALTWPITKMKCVGTGMVYSSSRNSLIFPFTQDGLGGVAEYLNP
ncbi:MAG: hypothetical protein JST04_13695 [Bdellovibrionales bacterium]|nr:hypothetical protein [Bdellovibrionales bacterium]